MKKNRAELTAFGKEVKKRLIDIGMTQVELATMVGISKQYLYKILCGERSGGKYIEEIKATLNKTEAA